MPASLIDTHCHLDDKVFAADRSLLIEQARQADITDIIVPAIRSTDFAHLQSIVRRFPGLHACAGLHPLFLDDHTEHCFAQVSEAAMAANIIAIGECGLDHSESAGDRNRQLALFQQHIDLAVKTDLPLIVHANRAVEAVLQRVSHSPTVRGVIHSFNGSYQQACGFLKLDFKLGFGGAITHPRATRLRQLVAKLPLESLLLETDAPYQTGHQHKTLRNEPAWLVEVLDTVASLRPESREAIARGTTLTAQRLFGLTDSD